MAASSDADPWPTTRSRPPSTPASPRAPSATSCTRTTSPSIETLFRLADHFDTDRVEILILAGHLQRADQLHAERSISPERSLGPDTAGSDDEHLTWQLIQEFRQVPAEWKGEAVQQIAMFTRLAKLPPTGFQPAHVIGDEEDEEKESDQTPADQPTTQAA